MESPTLLIKNTMIHLENGETLQGNLFIENGKVSHIDTKVLDKIIDPLTTIINGEKLHLIPGFIDTHIHGANQADTMDATEEALDRIAGFLSRHGTTSFLATTITQREENIEAALHNIAVYKNKNRQAEVLGIHLEGPFLEKTKAGAQPEEHILKPDLELFKHWQMLSGNNIKTITMAPELDPNGEFIHALHARGINISAGHTNASFSDMQHAANQGVSQLTHLCNAMNGIHHRDVGAVGAAFLLKELKAEIIADEIHLAPEMLEVIYQNMGSERVILISDAMRATGLPAGGYELGGQNVTVKNKKATLSDGTIAGSVLTMHEAAVNMLKIPEVTFADIIKMTAENPAKQIGVSSRKGSISIGNDADLLLVDESLNIHYTICNGLIRED